MVVHKTKDDFPSTNVGGPKNEEFLGAKRAECPASRSALRPFGWSITRSLRQAQLGWWLWCFFNGTYLQFFEDDDIVVMLRKAAFLRQDAFFCVRT